MTMCSRMVPFRLAGRSVLARVLPRRLQFSGTEAGQGARHALHMAQAASALGENLDEAMVECMLRRAEEVVDGMDGGRLTLKRFQELVYFYCG